MIVKERKIPLEILKLEALLRRLQKNHPKLQPIEEVFLRKKSGFQGELSLNYFLDYLPENFLILNDLRLHEGKRYFQIDCLILTKAFVLILEVKNFSGTLIFDTEFSQMIRMIKDKEEAFPDPILQVERQKLNLANWFSTHSIPILPIETLVIISNPHTIIKAAPNSNQISRKVIHSANLNARVEQFKQKHKQDKLSDKDLKKIARLLMKKNEVLDPNLLEQYLISEQEIVTGVHCTNCLNFRMNRSYGYWSCSVCKEISKDAHLASLADYALLISPFITNQEARRFLELDSVTVTSKILSSMNVPQTGRYKGRRYELQSLFK